jgi:hypothetical protein
MLNVIAQLTDNFINSILHMILLTRLTPAKMMQTYKTFFNFKIQQNFYLIGRKIQEPEKEGGPLLQQHDQGQGGRVRLHRTPGVNAIKHSSLVGIFDSN